MSNVYYAPQESGLKILFCIDEPDLDYAYNKLVVFEHIATGRLYWAQNSGCSCPSPFEDYFFTSPNNHDLNEIVKSTLDEFIRALKAFPGPLDEIQAAEVAIANKCLHTRKRTPQ